MPKIRLMQLKAMQKKQKIVLGVVGAVVVAGAGLFLFRKSLLGVAANGADYVLRPLIGSENTLKIESFIFSLEDKANQLHNSAPTSAESAFTLDGSSRQLNDRMPLQSIKLLTSLQPFQDEGVWTPMPIAQFPNQEVMSKTLLHVDNQRSYAYVALVKMDMSYLKIGMVAGIKQPGGPVGNPGEGKVPDQIKLSGNLVAAFDGGFQYRDGAYGMIVDGKTYLPLRPGLATMWVDAQGHAQIGEYEGGAGPAGSVQIRQNGPLLVKDGQITSFTEAGKDTWGRTVTNSIYTWRSGIGVTKDGDLIYAVGPSLHPETLAAALQAAGAVNAMQLDINPYWVRFVVFQPLNTQPGSATYQAISLLKNMENGGASYIQGYQKDFFYMYKR